MQNFKELRKNNLLTQDDVAKKIGVQRYTYAKWEQGRAEPSIQDLNKLATLYDCSIDYLLGRVDDYGSSPVRVTKKTSKIK